LFRNLDAAGLCAPPKDWAALTGPLDEGGVLQEFGIGIRVDGTYGFKLYWEFNGWNDAALRHVLDHFSLEDKLQACLPFNAGTPPLISRREAEGLQFGLALRLHPQYGFKKEATVAWKFPAHVRAARDFSARLAAFCAARRGNAEAYVRFTGRTQGRPLQPSLMTTTVCENGTLDTVYVRVHEMVD
jgi:hypothetical protein